MVKYSEQIQTSLFPLVASGTELGVAPGRLVHEPAPAGVRRDSNASTLSRTVEPIRVMELIVTIRVRCPHCEAMSPPVCRPSTGDSNLQMAIGVYYVSGVTRMSMAELSYSRQPSALPVTNRVRLDPSDVAR